MTAVPPFWDRARHRDRRPFLLARNRIVAALRAWFAGQGFTEVEAAILQVSPGNETHLHGFATELVGPDAARGRRYLHTSPEFAMKKLLAAGEEQNRRFRPRLPQSRARTAACAGIHHARMVPRPARRMRR